MIVLTMKDEALTVEVDGDGTLLLQHLEAALDAFRNTHNKNGNDGQTCALRIKTPAELVAEEVEA